MATDFAGRTVANGLMIFGMKRTKRLKALAHWIAFNAQLDTALQRALVQKTKKDQVDTKAKKLSPGPLDSENKWTDWEA
eukprot:2957933-Ditylum_brightwellii.AAC.1